MFTLLHYKCPHCGSVFIPERLQTTFDGDLSLSVEDAEDKSSPGCECTICYKHVDTRNRKHAVSQPHFSIPEELIHDENVDYNPEYSSDQIESKLRKKYRKSKHEWVNNEELTFFLEDHKIYDIPRSESQFEILMDLQYRVQMSSLRKLERIRKLELDLRSEFDDKYASIEKLSSDDLTVIIHLSEKIQVRVFFSEYIGKYTSIKRLRFPLGKTLYNSNVHYDFGEKSHLLIIGDNEQDKHNLLNVIVTSLISKYLSEEMQFIYIDPKSKGGYDQNIFKKSSYTWQSSKGFDRASDSIDMIKNEIEGRLKIRKKLIENDGIDEGGHIRRFSKPKPYIFVLINNILQCDMEKVKDNFEYMLENGPSVNIYVVAMTDAEILCADDQSAVVEKFTSRVCYKMNKKCSEKTIGIGNCEQLFDHNDVLYAWYDDDNKPHRTPIQPLRVQIPEIIQGDIEKVIASPYTEPKPESKPESEMKRTLDLTDFL